MRKSSNVSMTMTFILLVSFIYGHISIFRSQMPPGPLRIG